MEQSNYTEREKKIIAYLDEHDVWCEREPQGSDWELSSHTSAGGDMYWTLEELSKDCLQRYIDDFDINEEVLLWWQSDNPGGKTPFSNVKEHYEDLEEWLDNLQDVCDFMPE